jgi:hypothetical protein
VPWGKKHPPTEDLEDEAYSAEVERQMKKNREQRQTFTQTQVVTQPHALPNPNLNDKAEV